MAQIYNSQLDAFDLYHLYTERTKKPSILDGPALPAIGHALAGAAGSAISNTAVYPLDLIITRMQIQRQLHKRGSQDQSEQYASIADAARKIYHREGGLGALYAGVKEDTGKSIADAFLFFLSYNFLRQLREKRLRGNASHLSAIDELSVGFVAGAFSKLLTTPIANVVTRLQTSSMTHSARQGKATAASIMREIRAEKGIKGFWSGYSASLVLTLNPSLTFFFFETLKRFTLPKASREHPSPAATFILAACSKAMASTITYPFSLAKARAQSSSKSVDDSEDEHPEPTKETPLGESWDTISQHTSNGSSKTAKAPASKTASRQAAQTTVFAVVAAIARDEGLGALYEGLSGEVLKGFFSHGITMLMKEAVHKLIIQLYYVILKLLRRYPSPQELADRARDSAQDAGEKMQALGQEASEKVSEAVTKAKATISKQ